MKEKSESENLDRINEAKYQHNSSSLLYICAYSTLPKLIVGGRKTGIPSPAPAIVLSLSLFFLSHWAGRDGELREREAPYNALTGPSTWHAQEGDAQRWYEKKKVQLLPSGKYTSILGTDGLKKLDTRRLISS